jgi:protein ImuA
MEGTGPRMAPTPTPELCESGDTHLTPTHPRVFPDSEGLLEEAPCPTPQAPSSDLGSDTDLLARGQGLGTRGSRLATSSLDSLLDGRRLWRAEGHRSTTRQGLPTGLAVLDAALPEAGWPGACLTEILGARPGSGELSLVLPGLARLAATGGWICWISPPHIPYPPALAAIGLDLSRQLVVQAGRSAERAGEGAAVEATEALWAMEQALASGACDAVLAWAEPREAHWPRRLQLAAEQGDCRGLLFRDLGAARRPSAAALRLRLTADAIEILKCRGGRPARLSRPD